MFPIHSLNKLFEIQLTLTVDDESSRIKRSSDMLKKKAESISDRFVNII